MTQGQTMAGRKKKAAAAPADKTKKAAAAAGGRSRRKRAEPTRYSDDQPDTVTYDQQYGDGRRHEDVGAPAPGGAAASKSGDAHTSSVGNDQALYCQEITNNGEGAGEPKEEEKEPDGAITHRVSVLPALRYVRPAYLQAAVDTLKDGQKQKQLKAKDNDDGDDATNKQEAVVHFDIAPDARAAAATATPRVQGNRNSKSSSKPSSRSHSRRNSSSDALAASIPNSELYLVRKQAILTNLKSDPALTPLFGPSLGLLHRSATLSGGTGGAGGTDDIAGIGGGAAAVIRQDGWDAVRYNQFYYPGDYIAEDGGNSDAGASRKRLKPGVLPVSRAVTVLAMTKDSDQTPTISVVGQHQQQYRCVAVGDTAGFVTLYATEPILSPVSRLETTAARRDYEEELELRERFKGRKRGGAAVSAASSSAANSATAGVTNDDGAISKRGGTRFAGYRTVIDSSRPLVAQFPNAIEALAFNCSGTRIVIATKFEIELIDCLTGSTVWSCTTDVLFGVSSTDAVSISDKGRLVISDGASKMTRGPPLKISCHPTLPDGDIVVGYGFESWNRSHQDKLEDDEFALEDRDISLVSPLLQFATKTQRDIAGNAIATRVRVRGIVPVVPESDINTVRHPLAMGHRSIAVYDESNSNRILAIIINTRPRSDDIQADLEYRSGGKKKDAIVPSVHLQQLLLLDTSKSPYEVITARALPAKTASSKISTVEALCQSDGGTYTAAATSFRGGIRLFRTEGLVHLATYGEGMALHGRTVMWQDLSIVKRGVKKGGMEEREDEVALRSSNNDTARDGNKVQLDHTDFYLVGVPHAFREPKDLNDRVYLWDMADVGWGGTKLPSVALMVPPKSNGISSVLYDGRPNSSVGDASLAGGGGRFILSTQSGECHELGPRLLSEWPGRMYPPGYTVIDESVEYIEDEDELDIVVDEISNVFAQNDAMVHVDLDTVARSRKRKKSTPSTANVFEDDLKKALQESAYDADVDIINIEEHTTGSKGETNQKSEMRFLLSTRPESYLSSQIQGDECGLTSPTRSTQRSDGPLDIMGLLPQTQAIEDLIQKNMDRENAKDDPEQLESLMPKVSLVSQVRKGSRGSNKRGSVEATLLASIDPGLRTAMMKKAIWSEGKGSSLYKPNMCVENDKTKNCEACLGRAVPHRCGFRLIPEDYEAIARAEEEQKKKEAEAKRKAQQEKRKEKEAQRREAKRQKKLEEEEWKLAIEKEEKERIEEERRQREEAERRQREEAERRQREEAERRQREEEERKRIERIQQDNITQQEAIKAPQRQEQQRQEQQRQERQRQQQSFHSADSLQIPQAPISTTMSALSALAAISAAGQPILGQQKSDSTVGTLTPAPVANSMPIKRSPEEELERRNIALQLLGIGMPRTLMPTVAPPSAVNSSGIPQQSRTLTPPHTTVTSSQNQATGLNNAQVRHGFSSTPFAIAAKTPLIGTSAMSSSPSTNHHNVGIGISTGHPPQSQTCDGTTAINVAAAQYHQQRQHPNNNGNGNDNA